MSKVLRELRRIGSQITDPALSFFEDRQQARHDRDFHELISVSEGQVARHANSCIFLLFQPDGIAPSSYETIAHVHAAGYAVSAISNAPLGKADRGRLCEVCHLVVERPNYGYDFGGYRDGVRLLQERGAIGERLLILNDSIWFPLWEGDRLIENLERQSDGLTGPVYEQKEGRRHAGHFESYFLMLGPQALSAPAFEAFWQGYRVSSRRRNVLKRGEKAFSRQLIEGGVPFHTEVTRADFLDLLNAKDDEFLVKTLTYAAYDSAGMAAEGQQILAARDGDFRGRALSHIARHCRAGSVQETFIFAAMTLFHLPLMKKRQKPLTLAMRQAYLRAVDAQDLPAASDTIMSELRKATPVSPE